MLCQEGYCMTRGIIRKLYIHCVPKNRACILLPDRQVHRCVGQKLTLQLVLARLDYCNSILAGLPLSSLDP